MLDKIRDMRYTLRLLGEGTPGNQSNRWQDVLGRGILMVRHFKWYVGVVSFCLVFLTGILLCWHEKLFAASLSLEQQLKPTLDFADTLVTSRQYGRAFDYFVRCADLARNYRNTTAFSIDEKANKIMKGLDKMTPAQLNAIESALPAWSDLKTAGGHIWIKRFYEQRIRLAREAGNMEDMDRYCGLVHTTCARIIKEHSGELICRQAVRGYREFNSKNATKEEEPVLETSTSPVVQFVTSYSDGEDAQQ